MTTIDSAEDCAQHSFLQTLGLGKEVLDSRYGSFKFPGFRWLAKILIADDVVVGVV